MQCVSCGNELPRGVAHCPSCGTISSDKMSHSAISPDDPTTVSSLSSASPVSTNYGSEPYEFSQNPYEHNPYRSITSPPPPPPTRRRVKVGLVIGILALVLILVSGVSTFVWLAQRKVGNTQNTLTNSSTVSPTSVNPPPPLGAFDTSFYYRLTNSFLGTGQALDVRSDGSHLLKMAQTGNYSGQFWKLVDRGAGKYALRTAYLGDGFSLDVVNNGVNDTPWMYASGNYSGQLWSLMPWGDGTYKLTNDFTGTDKSLDTYSDTHEPFLDGGDHTGQHWTLTQLTRISG